MGSPDLVDPRETSVQGSWPPPPCWLPQHSVQLDSVSALPRESPGSSILSPPQAGALGMAGGARVSPVRSQKTFDKLTKIKIHLHPVLEGALLCDFASKGV